MRPYQSQPSWKSNWLLLSSFHRQFLRTKGPKAATAAEDPKAIRPSMWNSSLAHGRNTRASDRVGNDARLIREARQSIVRTSPSDVHCAFIQSCDPATLTDTSEKKIRRGCPSAVPR